MWVKTASPARPRKGILVTVLDGFWTLNDEHWHLVDKALGFQFRIKWRSWNFENNHLKLSTKTIALVTLTHSILHSHLLFWMVLLMKESSQRGLPRQKPLSHFEESLLISNPNLPNQLLELSCEGDLSTKKQSGSSTSNPPSALYPPRTFFEPCTPWNGGMCIESWIQFNWFCATRCIGCAQDSLVC